jgi:lysine 2,3-aminomutase
MLQRTNDYLQQIMRCEPAVRKQFEYSDAETRDDGCISSDPLHEAEHEVVPGMIHKYGNRALCLMTAECAAYCRFCTRRRLVSDLERGRISCGHVDGWVAYLRSNPIVREVILSGGDPFIVEDDLFEYALSRMSYLDSITVVRIGTRAPVSDPSLINQAKLDAIRAVNQPVYVGVHFEHPSELTDATLHSLRDLRKAGAILYSQSVFLRGVNDNYDTLHELFTRLVDVGVRPYYIYRCDPVPGAMHFIVDFDVERAIMTRLRKTLSGLACPSYVIDAPDGSGKIPVPLEFWDSDTHDYTDFEGIRHTI